MEVRPQHVACEQEAQLDEVVRPLEGAVLVLDRHDAVIAAPVELREPQLQPGTSTQRRSAFDNAIASPSTFARWPSANVGYSGLSDGRPTATSA